MIIQKPLDKVNQFVYFYKGKQISLPFNTFKNGELYASYRPKHEPFFQSQRTA
jgi:hypothetical protein